MSYTFLRWYRQGIAAALDASQLDEAEGSRARLRVAVEVSATGISNQTATIKVDVLGPGDVSGLDHRQVVRSFPVPGTIDFEPGYFAHVEFRRPDLPWLFSPVAPNPIADAVPLGWDNAPYRKQHTVTPWLCLAVVPKREGVSIERGTPLPRLTIADNASAELPLLGEAHAWAHVQVSGIIATNVDDIAATAPDRLVSRLMCPRQLEAGRNYIACVVPVFKSGVEAGLGKPITVKRPDRLAWSTTDTAIELPLYYHWEFATGAAGDFEALVRRLQLLDEIPGAGTRPMDTATPGFGLADRAAGTTIDLGGALRVTAAAVPPIDATFAAAAAPILNASDAVAPPIYGRWHAPARTVAPPAGTPGWVDALNLDPRYRVAAGLGTRVVQDRQEDLMAAIWRQFGEIVRANQLLRQSQLAVAASERVLARHLAPLSDLELIAIAGPAAGRIRVGAHQTLRGAIRNSCLPLIAVSGAFRRVLRARGPIARRLARAERVALPDTLKLDAPVLSARSVLEQLAAGHYRLPAARPPDGSILAPFDLNLVRPPQGAPPPPPAPRVPADLLAALRTLQRRVRAGRCTPLAAGSLAQTVRGALAPDTAIGARVRAQFTLPEGVQISARLDPIMVAPEIPTPMIGPLQDFGQDWLLPGLEALPRNSVTIVEPDAAVIESYMVGLNHEMARELLWRGFPTDQRGTVFSRFWDRRGAITTAAAPVPAADIDPIHRWPAANELGTSLTPTGREFLVLLIRGDLLQRYPLATIYMQRASWKRDSRRRIIVTAGGIAVREPVALPDDRTAWDNDVRWPSFSGRLGGDITFLGFPLSRDDVRGRSPVNVPPRRSGNAGWFVVFQEQPTEPRFGLDASGAAVIAGWSDIGWANFSTTAAESGYIKLAETSTIQGFADLHLQPAWDGRSESLAAIVQKKAFRLFVHARDLVPGA